MDVTVRISRLQSEAAYLFLEESHFLDGVGSIRSCLILRRRRCPILLIAELATALQSDASLGRPGEFRVLAEKEVEE